MVELSVWKYTCSECSKTIFRKTPKNIKCCKVEMEVEEFKYQNVFNIKKFAKEEAPDLHLSKIATALFYDMIETVVSIQIARCEIRAEEKGNKTILQEHFDWNLAEEFKQFLESRGYDIDIKN